MSFADFRSVLSEAKTRTISGAFDDFLDRKVNIKRTIRDRAGVSQNHLRDFLSGEYYRDDTFPRILSDEDRDFLGGSFARHTKIWPLDDIDIYFPIDGSGLVYSRGGINQPYSVVTDDADMENALLKDQDRWMNGSSISSKKLINGFAKVLKRHYPDSTPVRRVGAAVNVQLTQGANAESDGLGFDIVPCFSMRHQYQANDTFYLIPDGNDGWIHTNPRLDQDFSDMLNRENGRTVRKSVKLFKWWNEQNLSGRINSYYAELAVMNRFYSTNQIGRTITAISQAADLAFQAVRDAAASGNLHPLIVNAPMVERGDITQDDLSLLGEASRHATAAVAHELQGRPNSALKEWSNVFGSAFPT